MAAPQSMAGMPTTVKIDGTDLHDYGMVVNKIDNPVPRSRTSSVQIFGRDGDYDFTKNYGIRIMTLTGKIAADNQSDLISYIDSLKDFFRLRDNGEPFKLIFQNQTGRYWLCKYQGVFNIIFDGSWMLTTTASFTLILKCVNPYAEKTTVTTVALTGSILESLAITYNGTLPAPISTRLEGISPENLLEAAGGDTSDDNTLWSKTNCTGANVAGNNPYGQYWIDLTRIGAGAYYGDVDVTAKIDTSKYYAFIGIVFGADLNKTEMSLIQDGSGGNITVVCTAQGMQIGKIQPSELSGATSVVYRINQPAAGAPVMGWDAMGIYEITAAEYSDSSWIPYPFQSDPAGDDKVPFVDPKIWVFRGLNIMRESNGDDTTNWIGTGHIVNDPFVPAIKAFMVKGSNSFLSPKIYINPNKYYRITFQYYYPIHSATSFIRAYIYRETGSTPTFDNVLILTSAVGVWTQAQATYSPSSDKSLNYMRIGIDAGADSLLYVKQIIIEEVTVSPPDYAGYEKEDSLNAQLTASLDESDFVQLDSELLVGTVFDFSANTNSNIMSGFSGEKLLLEPGSNIVRVTDKRDTSSDPEGLSSGLYSLTLSYRERYL